MVILRQKLIYGGSLVAKRAITGDVENPEKRTRLVSSPKVTARNPPGQLKIPPVDASKLLSSEMPRLPNPAAAAAAQAHVLNLNQSMLGPPQNPQVSATMQAEYQRLLRMKTQAQYNVLNQGLSASEKEALTNTGIGLQSTTSTEQGDVANMAASITAALKASQDSRAVPVSARGNEETPAVSAPMVSSSSSQSIAREAQAPPVRPQPQPQHASAQKAQEMAERGSHSRSQSNILPSQQHPSALLPAQNISGPNEQVNPPPPQTSPQQNIRGTPQHQRMESVASSTAVPSPMGPPSVHSSPQRPEMSTGHTPAPSMGGLGGINPQTTPAMLAQLKAMAQSNSRLLDTSQSSEAQKLWAARMVS